MPGRGIDGARRCAVRTELRDHAIGGVNAYLHKRLSGQNFCAGNSNIHLPAQELTVSIFGALASVS
jgi:hypothetical protein